MALSLPRFISLELEGKYLVCGENGVMQFTGEDVLSPLARIEVERAKCSEELVHLRHCYNNKYLRMLSETDDSIAAIAVEPEEDQSKWSCTLFRPRPRQPTDSSTLSSYYSNTTISNTTGFEFQIMAAAALSSETDSSATATDSSYLNKLRVKNLSVVGFAVTDTEAVVQLPQYIILKGDNGKYLKEHNVGEKVELRFSGDEEKFLDAALLEVIRMSDASVRLRKTHVGFLRFNGNYVVPEYAATQSSDLQTRFKPLKLGSASNTIGLKVLSNNRFCKRTGTNDCLGATSTREDSAAVLEVEEALCGRSIYDVKYRMEDARIYDFAPVTSVTEDVTNQSQSTQVGDLTFTYTETKSQCWGNMTSWGVGVSVSMSVKIPFIGGPSVELGAEYEGDYEWGEAQETETQVATKLKLEVPPMTKTQVTMIVSRGTLEVPFSYTQRDTLYDSSVIVTEVDGGVFTGVNTYVTYETTDQSLSSLNTIKKTTTTAITKP